MGNAEIVLEEFGSGVLTHIHSITNNLSAAAPKDPMANAMSEMMERIKSGNIQLKSVRTVSLIFSRLVSRSRLHAVKLVLGEIIYHCFLVVCRSSIEIFKRCYNRLLKTSIDYRGEKIKFLDAFLMLS